MFYKSFSKISSKNNSIKLRNVLNNNTLFFCLIYKMSIESDSEDNLTEVDYEFYKNEYFRLRNEIASLNKQNEKL